MCHIRRIAVVVLLLLTLLAPPAAAPSAPAVRTAVTRALPLLQSSAGRFAAQRACVSCHHNSLAALTLRLAQQRGFVIDTKVLGAVEARTFRELRNARALDDAVQAANIADPTPNESYMLMAAHAAGIAPSLTTGVYARRMARWQRDGHWITSDFRPPHSSSLFTATATAVRALQFYLPAELQGERDAVTARARQWLAATVAESTEDAAFRLMGLVWAGGSTDERAAAVRDLVSRQLTEGGWPQLRGYAADAYSTGEALVALHEAGVPLADPARQKGLRFLLSTQRRDGTWRVRTRMISPAQVSPPYFATGYPYEKDEFLSYAGGCWAVMALLSSLPEAPALPAVQADADTSSAPAWAAAALFGTTVELQALLDSGVDPNSRTAHGTTMLMMAAPDAEKVRLLIGRGADVRARSDSGVDAVSAAAASHGTTASIRLLLDAGAVAGAPGDIGAKHSPLVLASMTGDADSVKLLLERGATASIEAVSEAVTFGHAGVLRLLLETGVDVDVTERSGINLLHWAAITNRPSVIPLLAAAGVAIDATDDAGFTPLMYASTVDVGDVRTLRALLAAGADRRIRNASGRTPFEQARKLRHQRIADALK